MSEQTTETKLRTVSETPDIGFLVSQMLGTPGLLRFACYQDAPEHWMTEIAFGQTKAFAGGPDQKDTIVQLAHSLGILS